MDKNDSLLSLTATQLPFEIETLVCGHIRRMENIRVVFQVGNVQKRRKVNYF